MYGAKRRRIHGYCPAFSDVGDISVDSSNSSRVVGAGKTNVEILVHLDDVTDAKVFNMPEERGGICISTCGSCSNGMV